MRTLKFERTLMANYPLRYTACFQKPLLKTSVTVIAELLPIHVNVVNYQRRITVGLRS